MFFSSTDVRCVFPVFGRTTNVTITLFILSLLTETKMIIFVLMIGEVINKQHNKICSNPTTAWVHTFNHRKDCCCPQHSTHQKGPPYCSISLAAVSVIPGEQSHTDASLFQHKAVKVKLKSLKMKLKTWKMMLKIFKWKVTFFNKNL